MIALALAGAASRTPDSSPTLKWHPIAAQPFTAAARHAKGPRHTALLDEALRRDPRAAEPRLALIRDLIRRGHMSAAVDQLAVLNRLDAPLTDEVLKQVAGQIDSASRARSIAETFRSHPELFIPVLSRMAQSASKAPAIALVRHMPASAFDIPQIRTAAIGILADGGEYRRAYALWSGTLAPPPTLRDPRFTGNTPPGPFSWQFTSGDAGAASPTPGGLELAAFGQQSGILASQLLLLPPGQWRITLRYEIKDRANSAIALTLRCRNSGPPLASALLDGSPGSSRTLTLDAAVPGNHCGGQQLQIEAMPSDDLQDMHARAVSVQVTPVNS